MSETKSNLPATAQPSETALVLGETQNLNLTGLTPAQIGELRRQHAAGLIDVQRKAEEMKVDVGALDATLSSITDQTAKATQAGSHITTTHTQTTSIGRTETVIGNTERAAAGKLSRSASGLPDNMLIYVIIAAVAVVIVAFLAFGR